MNANGNNNDNGSGAMYFLIIIVLAITVVGIVIWLIYKIIKAICNAVARKKQEKLNKPVIV